MELNILRLCAQQGAYSGGENRQCLSSSNSVSGGDWPFCHSVVNDMGASGCPDSDWQADTAPAVGEEVVWLML